MVASKRKQRSVEIVHQQILQSVALSLAGVAKTLRNSIAKLLLEADTPALEYLRCEYLRWKGLSVIDTPTDFADQWAQITVFSFLFSRATASKQIVADHVFLFIESLLPTVLTELQAVVTSESFRTLRQQYHNQVLVHLYAAFVAHYAPETRKRLGVWYTPQCVVHFMVKATQLLLTNVRAKVQEEIGVRIIEPAAGSGVFLAEIVRALTLQKRWEKTELHGFEISWPSYCLAQINCSHAYHSAGGEGDPPIQLYQTNALLVPCPEITKEGKKITIVIGNPPYNRGSSNNSAWITELIKKYKPYRDDAPERLDEINIVALSDDYVKFMALAQYYVEQSGTGIVAFITNKGYLDGIIHRQMRYELLTAFDTIYILNLHGDSRYNPKTPSGEKDENIFNIKTGVCISIFVRHATAQNGLAKVYYHELYGLRTAKEAFLNTHTLQTVPWQRVTVKAPFYYFVPKDYALEEEYRAGFGIHELFEVYSTAVETQRDKLAIQWQAEDFEPLRNDASLLSEAGFRTKYAVGEDGRDWKLSLALKDFLNTQHNIVTAIDYFPFDQRYVLYGKQRGLVAYPHYAKLGSMLVPNNLALLCLRTVKGCTTFHHCFVSQRLVDRIFFMGNTTVFPLYRIPDASAFTPQEILTKSIAGCITNFRPTVLNEIEKRLGASVEPLELFDYIYAHLNAPNYCTRYEAFLKIDFPRIPYPTDISEYRRLAAIGTKLRSLHLMEACETWKLNTIFPVAGSNRVEGVRYTQEERVYINAKQYFQGISAAVWQTYIGAYQPAQKWLKARKGRTLLAADILHYQRILYVLEQNQKLHEKIESKRT